MRQVSVDARGKDNRAEQFKVVTTILDESVGGGQIADLYERRSGAEKRQAQNQAGGSSTFSFCRKRRRAYGSRRGSICPTSMLTGPAWRPLAV